jgi:hypothetical protein
MNRLVPTPGAEKKCPKDLLTEVRRSTDNEIRDERLQQQNVQRLTGKQIHLAEVEATTEALRLVTLEVDDK